MTAKRSSRRLVILLFAIVAGSSIALGDDFKSAQAVSEAVNLFDESNRSGLTTWLADTGRDDPHGVFTFNDGVLHIRGKPHGYIGTTAAYRDYHLIVEFKWGRETYKSKTVRNSGILMHAVGPDGNRNPWMASIECQLAQGCVGDLIPIRGRLADGSAVPVRFTSKVANGPDGRPRWNARGEPRIFTDRQLWWSRHDPEFKEAIDTRGRFDVESPLGEWTRVECICQDDRITILVNGHIVNTCHDAYPSAGRILLQSEGFEMEFRRFELRPLPAHERRTESESNS